MIILCQKKFIEEFNLETVSSNETLESWFSYLYSFTENENFLILVNIISTFAISCKIDLTTIKSETALKKVIIKAFKEAKRDYFLNSYFNIFFLHEDNIEFSKIKNNFDSDYNLIKKELDKNLEKNNTSLENISSKEIDSILANWNLKKSEDIKSPYEKMMNILPSSFDEEDEFLIIDNNDL